MVQLCQPCSKLPTPKICNLTDYIPLPHMCFTVPLGMPLTLLLMAVPYIRGIPCHAGTCPTSAHISTSHLRIQTAQPFQNKETIQPGPAPAAFPYQSRPKQRGREGKKEKRKKEKLTSALHFLPSFNRGMSNSSLGLVFTLLQLQLTSVSSLVQVWQSRDAAH